MYKEIDNVRLGGYIGARLVVHIDMQYHAIKKDKKIRDTPEKPGVF